MKKLTTILLALAFFMGIQQTNAQATLRKIESSGVLRVGTSGDQVPFTFIGKDGKIMGYDIAVAQTLAKDMHVGLKIIKMPFSQLIPSLLSGKIDIILSGMTITTQRNMKVIFAGHYYETRKSVLSLNPEIAHGEVSLLNKSSVSLAVLKGSTGETYARKRYPRANIIPVENYEAGMKLLQEKKVAGIVADFETCDIMFIDYPKLKLYYYVLDNDNDRIAAAIAPGDYLFKNLISNFMTDYRNSSRGKEAKMYWFDSADWFAYKK